ncbi:Uncharacterised protein [Shigella flexneri]|nr:Uncharacterised protein [Shigella flexneri]
MINVCFFEALSNNLIKQRTAGCRQPKTPFIAIAHRSIGLRPAQRALQVATANPKTLGTEVVRYTFCANIDQTLFNVIAIAHFAQNQGKGVTFQRP